MAKVKYVPECPHCGDIRTGIILYDMFSRKTQLKIMDKAAKQGYYIKVESPFLYKSSDIRPNCFCTQCSCEWLGECETIFLNSKEYSEYMNERNLTEYTATLDFTKVEKVINKIKKLLRKEL